MEKTNSNSISFRSDSKNEDNKTEISANSTDGSESCEESNSNKQLCPYVPQVVCVKALFKFSNRKILHKI